MRNNCMHDTGQRLSKNVTFCGRSTTPEEGGETVFPQAGSPAVTGPQWSDCARKGLAVKAVRGNALLFYSLKPNGCVLTRMGMSPASAAPGQMYIDEQRHHAPPRCY